MFDCWQLYEVKIRSFSFFFRCQPNSKLQGLCISSSYFTCFSFISWMWQLTLLVMFFYFYCNMSINSLITQVFQFYGALACIILFVIYVVLIRFNHYTFMAGPAVFSLMYTIWDLFIRALLSSTAMWFCGK